MSPQFNGYRRQQIVYGITLLFAILACVASGMINRFKDIDFSAPLLAQYEKLTNSAALHIYTNVALVVFVALLFLADLFRSKAVPVWFELIWTFVFGSLEIANLVILSPDYPTLHCTPSSVNTSGMRRRDSADGSVIGSYVNYNTSANAAAIKSEAAQEVCENWAVMFVFFSMLAMILFMQFGWLSLLGLRHRFTHPSFFWRSATPAPYTWHLERASSTLPESDAASISSFSSSSTFDEKKVGRILPMTAPIKVKLTTERNAQIDSRVC
jgi:hypothetical protein